MEVDLKLTASSNVDVRPVFCDKWALICWIKEQQGTQYKKSIQTVIFLIAMDSTIGCQENSCSQ